MRRWSTRSPASASPPPRRGHRTNPRAVSLDLAGRHSSPTPGAGGSNSLCPPSYVPAGKKPLRGFFRARLGESPRPHHGILQRRVRTRFLQAVFPSAGVFLQPHHLAGLFPVLLVGRMGVTIQRRAGRGTVEKTAAVRMPAPWPIMKLAFVCLYDIIQANGKAQCFQGFQQNLPKEAGRG